MEITKDIIIEDLVELVPASVKYMMEQGIRCIVCGEPIWGTLEEAAIQKGFSDTEIEKFITDLQTLYNETKDYRKDLPNNKIETEKLNLE